MIGIYKITNKLNNKCYIGRSVDINRRWRSHITKKQYWIGMALEKHGIENFTFEIIEECKREELNDKEIYWINFYDSYKKGYNASPGGNSNPHSEETKRKISISLGGDGITTGVERYRLKRMAKSKYRYGSKAHSDYWKKPVMNIDTNEEFDSALEASKKYNTTHNNISMAANGHRKTAAGYKWKFI